MSLLIILVSLVFGSIISHTNSITKAKSFVPEVIAITMSFSGMTKQNCPIAPSPR